MKFKKGDYLKVLSDTWNYNHCIGKIGKVMSITRDKSCIRLAFDFELPDDGGINNRGGLRDFQEHEVEYSKEYNITRILNKIDNG